MTEKMHDEFIKPLDTDFAKDDDEPSALQFIIDENFINGFLGQFLKIEKMYSLREFMNIDPRFVVFKQLLTTTTLGLALPSFKEEYGDSRPLDLVGTVSHDFIKGGLGEVTPTGFTLEKNGNFELTFNLGAQMIIENKKGVWEEARAMYSTIKFKGKMFVADAKFDNRTFVILPKGLQIAQLKVLKGEEEQFLEQMLIQSMLGMQLENAKKSMQPMTIPLKKFPNPKEVQCFGFNLTNVVIKVNKGFLQVNANYIKIDKPTDENYCELFEEALTRSPKAFFQKL
jgi:hypothetical protein